MKEFIIKNRDKIIYWFFTIWLALGMASTGIVQVIKMEEEVEVMASLGYPAYILTILGIWKILGVIAVLIPKFTLPKEWAYAGFFFVMSGAIFSHIVNGDGALEFFGPSLLLILTMISWYFRPVNRKINQLSNEQNEKEVVAQTAARTT